MDAWVDKHQVKVIDFSLDIPNKRATFRLQVDVTTERLWKCTKFGSLRLDNLLTHSFMIHSVNKEDKSEGFIWFPGAKITMTDNRHQNPKWFGILIQENNVDHIYNIDQFPINTKLIPKFVPFLLGSLAYKYSTKVFA